MDGLDFSDTMHPPSRLTPPGNYDQQAVDATREALAIAQDLQDILQRVVGVDPMAKVVDFLGINWGVFLSLRDMWNSVSYAMSDVGDNLLSGKNTLDPHWNGNAAQSFEGYMDRWIAMFEENQQAAAGARDMMNDLAENYKQGVEFVASAIKLIADSARPIRVALEAGKLLDPRTLRSIWTFFNQVRKVFSEIMKVINTLLDTIAFVKELYGTVVELLDDEHAEIKLYVPGAYTSQHVAGK
ncbi:WXG100 family type VII secretion target [Segniliparus rugosus]|uniref:WXG100 family type VII secretion target n=1 Tax=Segniliparus rugosus (strain ATCC BAA-974 / DSM 45345 / CCUG 50838 / CIP 108380 / JCM 13579 / CDC 945) TaxID=679197 RepID=E5XN50_SEGRC|nr:hypothetical protein [Segniliparus rugosus]EFV14227.1 hypothetical protein HMPREF9336_00920 [Segniliparus rugosus ATCC BAA-974]